MKKSIQILLCCSFLVVADSKNYGQSYYYNNQTAIQQNQQNININLPVIEKKVYIERYRTVYVDRPQPKRIAKKLSAPVLLHGFLWVYPEDIGNFKRQADALEIIRNINNQTPYGRNNWRIPTPGELAVLEANAEKIGLGDDIYLATDHANGVLRMVSTGKSVAEQQAERDAEIARQQKLAEARRQQEEIQQAERNRKELERQTRLSNITSEISANMVFISKKSFYISKYEVTQAQWETIMGYNPSSIKNPNNPVTDISPNEVSSFLTKLNQATGLKYRLPTESEYIYVSKYGGYKFPGSNNLNEVAWYKENSFGRSHPVGQKKPNGLGLYDLAGNVAEMMATEYGNVAGFFHSYWGEGYLSSIERANYGNHWNLFMSSAGMTKQDEWSRKQGSAMGFRLAL